MQNNHQTTAILCKTPILNSPITEIKYVINDSKKKKKKNRRNSGVAGRLKFSDY